MSTATARKINYEQQLLDILKEKSEHADEDSTFLLSFVPACTKLNDDRKYWARMEMLGITRKTKKPSMRNVLRLQLLYRRRMSIISNPNTSAVSYSKQRNCKFPICVGCIIQSINQSILIF
jgi:hypothetical protein